MQKPSVTRARIVLFGLKEHLASQLKQVLTAQDHEVYSQAACGIGGVLYGCDWPPGGRFGVLLGEP